MTLPVQIESHLLVVLGEVRADVKSTRKSLDEVAVRLTEMEDRMGSRIAGVEHETQKRLEKVEGRLKSLEAIRLKVAGFALAVAIFIPLLKDKLGPFLTLIAGG